MTTTRLTEKALQVMTAWWRNS